MNRVGFILKPDKTNAGALLGQLAGHVASLGAQAVVLPEDTAFAPGAQVVSEAELPSAIDMAVSLGGDGTMLRANDLVGDHGIPVLGVNLGRLGFMTQFDPAGAPESIRAALAGELEIAQRTRLNVRCEPIDREAYSRYALNEAVVHQSTMARLIDIRAFLDGKLITPYRADGLIVATPTGSTAYNLAAGGPIILPGHAAMAITPICAHGLTIRPLVVPSSSVLSLTLDPGHSDVVLTVDGHWARSFHPGERVSITEAEQPFRLFRSTKSDFDVLREKLHWGVRSF